jgi:uncharacterized protein YdaU (DUF1376 family)
MHHYRKNIGDYAKKAGRLSLLQHGVYGQLIDACYDRECFPTLEGAIDWTWASSQEEIEAVQFVLNKFFYLQEDGTYIQNRIEEEIQEYHGMCLSNGENGRKGGRPKGSKNKKNKTHSVNNKTHSVNLESDPNPSESEKKPKPLTTNHQPLNNQDTCAVAQTFIAIPTNKFESKKEAYQVTDQDVFEFRELYPAVNIEQELRAMRGWAIANKTKRKTHGGMARFVNSWLAREQNKGRSDNAQTRPGSNPTQNKRKPTPAERTEAKREAIRQRELGEQPPSVGSLVAFQ